VQGVIKAFDPSNGDGVIIAESDLQEYDLAPDALGTSIFRMLRQGQRVVFDLDERRLATRLRLGSEVDMGTPGFEIAHPDDPQHPQEGPDQRSLPPVT
jgi:cold shock CspA family protein